MKKYIALVYKYYRALGIPIEYAPKKRIQLEALSFRRISEKVGEKVFELIYNYGIKHSLNIFTLEANLPEILKEVITIDPEWELKEGYKYTSAEKIQKYLEKVKRD